MEFIQKVSDSGSKMYSKTIFLFSVASFLLLAVAVDVDTESDELDEADYNDEIVDDELIDDEVPLDDVMEPDEIDYIISEMEEKSKAKKKSRGRREKPTKNPERPRGFVRNCMKWDLC